MKTTLIIFLSILALFLLAVGYDLSVGPQFTPVPPKEHSEGAIETLAHRVVPDFSFETLDGTLHSIQDFRGKPVILNFWATWCPTCLVEFPAMLRLINQLDGKVVLLALSSDYAAADITQYIAKQDTALQDLFHSEAVYIAHDKKRAVTHDIFLTERYPETIILTPDGKMARKIVGNYDWEGDTMKHYLENLLP